ncbi:hypothetical protein DM791_03950 [Paenarthrobacter nitroguajacolicus]|nr:hypothetical protein [Paenarthrobacter nitroguajacolicus]
MSPGKIPSLLQPIHQTWTHTQGAGQLAPGQGPLSTRPYALTLYGRRITPMIQKFDRSHMGPLCTRNLQVYTG